MLEELEKHIALLPNNKKRKVVNELPSKPIERVYVIDKQGILVCEKNKEDGLLAEGTIDTSVFLDTLRGPNSFSTGLLPNNLIFYEKSKNSYNLNQYILVYEFKPCMYEAIFNQEYSKKLKPSYKISIPYTQFFLLINEQADGPKIAFGESVVTNKAISSENDSIYWSPLYNIYIGTGICWGTLNTKSKPNETPQQYGHRLCIDFFSTTFRASQEPKFPANFSYSQWEKDSQEDPFCWKKYKWIERDDHKTFGQMLEYFRKLKKTYNY